METVWTTALETGDPAIDADHRRLFQLYDDFAAAHEAGKGETQVGRLLADLLAYAVEHFAREEALMREIGYEAFPAHREAHLGLFDQVDALVTLNAQGKRQVTPRSLDLLRAWLVHHVRTYDKALAAALRRHRGLDGEEIPFALVAE